MKQYICLEIKMLPMYMTHLQNCNFFSILPILPNIDFSFPYISPCSVVSAISSDKYFKPIFHCDAKPFALGTFASPNAKDTNMLVSFALGDTNFSRHPTQNPDASQWNIGCVGFKTQSFSQLWDIKTHSS